MLEKYPVYQVPVDLFVGVPSTPEKLGPRIGPSAEVGEILAQALEQMVVGGKDPDQALDDAADRATKALQDYNQPRGGVGHSRYQSRSMPARRRAMAFFASRS